MFQRRSLLAIATLGLAVAPTQGFAATQREAQATVDSATGTVRRFRNQARARGALARCAGALVVSRITRVGLMVGGEYGNGVMLARRDDRVWSDPAFVRYGSASYGLQAGFKQYALMLVIMRPAVMRAMLTTGFEFGSHMAYAAGDQGTDFEGLSTAQLADVYYFSRTETGVYGGFSLEGSGVQLNNDVARAFFGRADAPAETILFERAPQAVGARSLRAAMAGQTAPRS
jgi:lipid-binding SYLF domain-containing protein